MSNQYDQLTSSEVEVIKIFNRRWPVPKSQLTSILCMVPFQQRKQKFCGDAMYVIAYIANGVMFETQKNHIFKTLKRTNSRISRRNIAL